MDNMVARLQVGRGPNSDREYILSEAETTIGRSSNNDIMLDDPEVSRRHARILRQGDMFQIVDWGSTNGTFVNSHRVSAPTSLQDSDIVELGESISLTFWQTITHVPTDPKKPVETQMNPSSKQEDIATQLDLSPPEAVIPAAPPVFEAPVPQISAMEQPPVAQQPPVPQEPAPSQKRARPRWLSCGCLFIILIFLCMATLFFLDSYQGGRLLYCGPLQPFFETALTPFGFAPPCS